MKLSEHTVEVLKNFATINQNLIIKEGSTLTTMSAMKNIVAKAAEAFSCSRTTVHRHLNRLLRDGKIIKSGTTRQAKYFLKTVSLSNNSPVVA